MAEAAKMSLKEADRYAVIVQVIQRSMGQADAAAWLNVSVRQVKRLVRMVYNFVKIHSSIKTTPALEAGVTDFLWSMEDIVVMAETNAQA